MTANDTVLNVLNILHILVFTIIYGEIGMLYILLKINEILKQFFFAFKDTLHRYRSHSIYV